LEIDGTTCVHSGFDMLDGGIDVPVEKFEVTNAITGEEGAGHGAVESG
jgi:hypothetical protein